MLLIACWVAEEKMGRKGEGGKRWVGKYVEWQMEERKKKSGNREIKRGNRKTQKELQEVNLESEKRREKERQRKRQ